VLGRIGIKGGLLGNYAKRLKKNMKDKKGRHGNLRLPITREFKTYSPAPKYVSFY